MYSCVMISSDIIAGKLSYNHEICFTKITDIYYNYTKNAVASYIVSDTPDNEHFISGDSIPNDESDSIFVFCGAFPFITTEVLDKIYNKHKEEGYALTLVTTMDDDESLVDTGIYLINKDLIKNINDFEKNLNKIMDDNIKIQDFPIGLWESHTVWDSFSLADATRYVKQTVYEDLTYNGVLIISPETTFISMDSEIARGTTIMPNTIIKGKTKIGENCIIGPNTQITDCEIADNVTISNSVLMESEVLVGANIGPFAYIRPNSKIGEKVKIGDFVEVKNATIDTGTKVAHLTYVGDADVGKGVNFGCGTVLVNYDGEKKYRSTIEDDVFIGCNTNLVSPVTVHKGAFIAAGSTITDDIPDNSLAIARARQINKTGWKKK